MSGGRGVLYVATGAAHAEAARLSARSVRATNPGLAIALFSDVAAAWPEFDSILPVSDGHRRSKVDYLGASPFAETLYLDSDTRVRGDLSELFRLLERFDLAAARRDRVAVRRKMPRWREDVPASFPEYNSGVMLYRGTPAVLAFLEDWRQAYAELGLTADQRTLRELLWISDLRLFTLPARYNARSFEPLSWLFGREERPVILHMNRFHPSKRRLVHRLLDPVLGT